MVGDSFALLLTPAPIWLLVYAAGVVWGLIRTDADPLARVGLALLWPLGPILFVLVVVVLLAAATIAFPLFGASVVVAALIAWMWLS